MSVIKKVKRLLTYVEVEIAAPNEVPGYEEYDRGYSAAFEDIKAKLEFVLEVEDDKCKVGQSGRND